MKTITKHLFLVMVLLWCGCAGWTINGVPCERFKNMTAADAGYISAGIAASFAAHWVGHIATAELLGYDWHQEGLNEVVYPPTTDSGMAWFGRSGFLSQLFIGGAIKYGPWSNDFKRGNFATGYHAGTVMEVVTYPVDIGCRGDLDLIDRNSNGMAEWFGYSVFSFMLLDPEG